LDKDVSKSQEELARPLPTTLATLQLDKSKMTVLISTDVMTVTLALLTNVTQKPEIVFTSDQNVLITIFAPSINATTEFATLEKKRIVTIATLAPSTLAVQLWDANMHQLFALTTILAPSILAIKTKDVSTPPKFAMTIILALMILAMSNLVVFSN
jgi:hypothetical protein